MADGGDGSLRRPYALWIAPVAVLLLVDMVIAPRRGALWSSDDGFFLMRSWNAIHGFGLDTKIVPQDPSYLFNAVLMWLGLSGLLAFRQAANLFTFVTAGAFFLALDPRHFRSPLVPMALCASLLVSLTSVSSPASLSFGFFMLGAAFLFLHIDGRPHARPWLGAMGGLCFALAGFMHAAVALALAVVCGLLAWGLPSLRWRSSFLACFTAVSGLLWGFYVRSVGLAVFLTPPAGHDAGVGHLSGRTGLLVRHFLEPLAAFALASAAFGKLGRSRFAAAQAALSLLVTLVYGWALLRFLAGLPPSSPLFGMPGLVYLFKEDSQYISRIPGAAVYLLYFAVFRVWAEAWVKDAMDSASATASSWRDRLFRILWGSPARRKISLAFFGFELINCALSVGSSSDVFQNFAFAGGPLVGLVIVMDGPGLASGRLPWSARLAPFLWTALLLAFTLGYNHPDNDPLFTPGRATEEAGPLRGILLSARYRDSQSMMEEACRTRDGEVQPLIVLDYVPLVYWLLGRHFPAYLPRPALGYSERDLLAELDPQRGWCVLDTTTAETRGYIRNRGSDIRAPLRAWVAAHSDRSVRIASPGDGIEDLTLYFRRPRRSP